MHTYGESGFVTLPDGRRLHHMSAGSGTPVVVFQSGIGGSRSWWGLVQPAVAAETRAVVYDRAGSGRSDDDPAPRTAARLAEDLAEFLDALGPGPFVLVGHSWGGPVVRLTAALRPDRTAGLVLVDQGDENCDLYFSGTAETRFRWTARLLPFLARTGLMRLGARPGAVQPADVAADLRRDDFGPRGAATILRELESVIPDLRGLRDAPPALPDVPVAVITGTKRGRLDRRVREQLSAAHRRTAAGLPQGRLVEAAGSDHLVMFTEPGIVVGEILRIVRAARAGATPG